MFGVEERTWEGERGRKLILYYVCHGKYKSCWGCLFWKKKKAFSFCSLFHEDESVSPWHRDIRHFIFLKPVTCLSSPSSWITYIQSEDEFSLLPVESSLQSHNQPEITHTSPLYLDDGVPLQQTPKCLYHLLVLSYLSKFTPSQIQEDRARTWTIMYAERKLLFVIYTECGKTGNIHLAWPF